MSNDQPILLVADHNISDRRFPELSIHSADEFLSRSAALVPDDAAASRDLQRVAFRGRFQFVARFRQRGTAGEQTMPRVNSRTLRALCVLGILTIAGGLPAQTTFATLRGTVHDPSGATIANATISLRNAATRVLRETRSNREGAWTVFDLPPSRYEITVAAPGFAAQRATDVELTVNTEQVLDLSLNPSTVQSSVDVRAEATGVDLDSADLSAVEDARAMRELPLNGRDWTQLALLGPVFRLFTRRMH